MLALLFDELGDEIISLETDRSIFIVVDAVGVSARVVQGIDVCVFVLLNDDVEPPVDVDWRCKFDVDEEIVEPNDERRFVDTGGLDRIFDDVEVWTIGIKRWVRDCVLFVVVVVVVDCDGVCNVAFDGGAVAGRILDVVNFKFDVDADVCVTGGLVLAEATRGTEFVNCGVTYNTSVG